MRADDDISDDVISPSSGVVFADEWRTVSSSGDATAMVRTRCFETSILKKGGSFAFRIFAWNGNGQSTNSPSVSQ